MQEAGAFFKGILYGLALAVLIGPVFFALVRLSIEKGFKSGFIMVTGVAASDILCILLAWFQLAPFVERPDVKAGLGIGGGLLLVVFGIVSFFKKGKRAGADTKVITAKTWFGIWLRGFVLNAVNPFTIFFWISTCGLVLRESYTPRSQFMFFLGTIATVFATDSLKSRLALFLSQYLSEKRLTVMNKTAGIILFGFGIRMLWMTFR
ncbi:MAG: LysE family transporter [Bacteroidota bacterium]